MSEVQRYQLKDIRALIYRQVLANPDVTLDELQRALHAAEMKMSLLATGSMASEFRRTLKFLTQEGLINQNRLQRQRTAAPTKLSTQRQAIIRALDKAKQPLGPNAIAAATDMPAGNVRYLLHEMVKRGDVMRYQHGKYGPKVNYVDS
jgi:Fe2+ or Zn2+ uptake regulation protein